MKTQEVSSKWPDLPLMSPGRHNAGLAQVPDTRRRAGVTREKGVTEGGAALAFQKPAPENYAPSEKQFLLKLARATLTRAATNGPFPEVSVQAVPPKLAEKKACFVTLTEGGGLRGCVGQLVPREPLYRAVEDNAQSAALRDRRFPPVQAAEVDRIKIEISVLTEPQPLRFNSPEELLGKLQPYNDGVLLKIGPRSATFLPQVWEKIHDKVAFLNLLSTKAGCAPSAWRGKDATVAIYHVEAFTEPE